jgi:hypothetical protein
VRLLLSLAIAASLLQTNTGDFVELDVVVVDRDNRPVLDLNASDFRVKEDGKAVELKTFLPPVAERETGRQIVLLLDDSSVPMGGTRVVQAMAQAILSRGTTSDDVRVVRLNNDRDEPFGDIETALSRIDGYRAGVVPFQNRGSVERVLTVIANISHQLEFEDHRRKVIVCIGGPRVCNVLEPQPRGYNQNWRAWVTALAGMARANVAVYAAMPIAPGVPLMLSGGLSELSGGSGFANTGSFERFVADLWDEAGRYYLLGYWPAASRRELHSIDVKVERKGARVRSRRQR